MKGDGVGWDGVDGIDRVDGMDGMNGMGMGASDGIRGSNTFKGL